LQYEAAMLESTYGQTRIDEDSFSSLLSSCGVPASSYPYTVPSTVTATSTATLTSGASVTSATAGAATCTGSDYTVQSGDSCQSIAMAYGIATDNFITDNDLDYNCTTLILGDTVCMGDSCDLYQVQTNDTCTSILAGQTYNLVQLTSWNPWVLQFRIHIDWPLLPSLHETP
jgi:hypothetical protein